jgi:hypothetical protein
VTIDAGDGQGCLKCFWWGGGGVMSHLRLVGGDCGWHVQETSQWAARSFELSGQRKASVWLDGVWNFALLDFRLRQTAAIQRAIDECREVFFPAGTTPSQPGGVPIRQERGGPVLVDRSRSHQGSSGP